VQITYFIPTTEKQKAFLCATIRQVFLVEPRVIYRARDRDPDLAKGDWWVHGHHLPGGLTPSVVFTLACSCTLSPAQRAVVNRADTQVERAYSPGEVLYESIRHVTYV
jgi:hypothetical protein